MNSFILDEEIEDQELQHELNQDPQSFLNDFQEQQQFSLEDQQSDKELDSEKSLDFEKQFEDQDSKDSLIQHTPDSQDIQQNEEFDAINMDLNVSVIPIIDDEIFQEVSGFKSFNAEQKDLFPKSVEKVDKNGNMIDRNNSIIFLDTGRGKTVIGMMHIYYYLKKYGRDKKIIFLGQTVQLVEQQAAQIRKDLYNVAIQCEKEFPEYFTLFNNEGFQLDNLKSNKFLRKEIIAVHADRTSPSNNLNQKQDFLQNSNRWTKERWDEIIEESTIYVMIGQALLNSLRRGYLKLSQISIIIFDECHHTKESHPYASIVKEFYKDDLVVKHIENSRAVKFLGLTASPVQNVSVKKIKNQVQQKLDSDAFKIELFQLCINLDAKIYIPNKQILQNRFQQNQNTLSIDQIEQSQEQISFQKTFQLTYKELDEFHKKIEEMNRIQNDSISYSMRVIIAQLRHLLTDTAINLLFELGRFAYYTYLKKFNDQLKKIVERLEQKKLRTSKYQDDELLKEFQKSLEQHIQNNLETRKEYVDLNEQGSVNNKFHKLLKVLTSNVLEYDKKESINIDESILNFVNPLKQAQQISQEKPLMMIFVTNKLTAQYMNNILVEMKKLELNEYQEGLRKLDFEYVVGLGRKNEKKSYQTKLIQGSNNFTTGNIRRPQELQIKASELYESLKRTSAQIEEESMEEANRFAQVNTDQYEVEEPDEQINPFLSKYLEDFERGILNIQKSFTEVVYFSKKQIKIINKFQRKEFNVLISTDVTEEGFNIPDCNIVIVYDPIKSYKQYIQQKGRARKNNSKYIILTQAPKKSIEDQSQIYEQASKLIKKIARKNEGKPLQDLEKELKQAIQDRNVKNHMGQASFSESYYERRLLKGTLALINTDWSVELLTNFVNFIQCERKGIKNEYYIKGALFYFVHYPQFGYICYIVLPKYAKFNRYYYGDLKNNKEDARRSAAFNTIIKLKASGLILGDLKPNKEILLKAIKQTDFYDDINDIEYQEIIQEEVIIKEEFMKNEEGNENRFLFERHFQSLPTQALNIQFMQSLSFDVFKQSEVPTKFNLFKLVFQYTDFKADFKNVNSQNVPEIGLIHHLPFNIDEFQFKFSKSNQRVHLKVIESGILLTYKQYQKLQLINNFLQSTVTELDIAYYSCISEQPIRPDGLLGIRRYRPDYIKLDNNKFLALLVLIKKVGDKYQVDTSANDEIQEYITYMKDIYHYLNNIKYWKQELQKQKQQVQILQTLQDPKIIRWNKMDLHKKHVEKIGSFKQDIDFNKLKSNYIIQNVSENTSMGKCIFMGCKQAPDLSKIEWKNKGIVQSMEARLKYQASTINNVTNEKWLFRAMVLRKYLKPTINQFLGTSQQEHQDEDRYKYFSIEWTCFPLNLENYFQISIICNHMMQQLHDYILSGVFKNNLLRNLEKKALQRVQDQQQEHYEIMIVKLNNIEQESKILEFIKEDGQYFKILQRLQKNVSNQDKLYVKKQTEQLKQKKSQNVFDQGQITCQQIPNGLIFQSLTARSYGVNGFDYEQLEILGDAVLKLLATIQVFSENQTDMEGSLHIKRAKIISNQNLRKIAIKNHFYRFIFVKQFEYNPESFVYEQSEEFQIKKEDEDKKVRITKKDQPLDTIPNDYKHIPEKVHADVLEAIIGAYMKTFGDIEKCQWLLYSLDLLRKPSIKVKLNQSSPLQFENQSLIQQNLNIIQNIIGYKFKSPEILLQSICHLSFLNVIEKFQRSQEGLDIDMFLEEKNQYGDLMIANRNITDDKGQTAKIFVDKLNSFNIPLEQNSYERLEYLGDAVLDLVTVDWIVKKFPEDNPGEISNKKSSIVCNKALALVSIHYRLHDFLLHDSIDNYRRIINDVEKNWDTYYRDLNKIYSNEPMIKVLGDIFESIIGAVFLDSGFDYELIRGVILGLLEEKFMNHFCKLQSNPQKLLMQTLHQRGFYHVDVRLNPYEDPLYGEWIYELYDKDTEKVIQSIRALGEKDAYEKLYELVSQNDEFQV